MTGFWISWSIDSVGDMCLRFPVPFSAQESDGLKLDNQFSALTEEKRSKDRKKKSKRSAHAHLSPHVKQTDSRSVYILFGGPEIHNLYHYSPQDR